MLRQVRDGIHPLHLLRHNRILSQVLLPKLDRVVRTRLAGVEWPVSVRLIRNFSYVIGKRLLEPGVTSLMDIVMTEVEPRSFWDVGANVGFYSWFFLSRVPDGFALMLEPEPDNISLLVRTAHEANLTRAVSLPMAASDVVGTQVFNRDPVSGATGGLVVQDEPFITRHYGVSPPQLTVLTTTLDELSQQYPLPDLIKIDVEGAEMGVFRGATQLIAKHKPTLFFETTDRNRLEAISLLSRMGYEVRPSAGPDVPSENATDFIAVPPRLRDAWPRLESEWRRRFK